VPCFVLCVVAERWERYTTTFSLLPGRRMSLYTWTSVERPVHLVFVDRSAPGLRVGSPTSRSIGLENVGDRLLLPTLSADLVLWADSLAPGNYSVTFRIQVTNQSLNSFEVELLSLQDAAPLSSVRLTDSRLPSSGDIVFLLQVAGSPTGVCQPAVLGECHPSSRPCCNPQLLCKRHARSQSCGDVSAIQEQFLCVSVPR